MSNLLLSSAGRDAVHRCGLMAMVMMPALTGGTGCERGNSPTVPAPAPAPIRIVSLSPAISRTLADLGLAGRIVGRSPYCDSIDQLVPVAGDLINVSYEQLARLEPTHILVQPPVAGLDPQLVSLAAQRGWRIGHWRLEGIADIRGMILELPRQLYAADSVEFDHARGKAASLLDRIDASLQADDWVFHGRTLLLSSADPPMAFGTGTYLHDVLTALGGRNAIDVAGWATLSMEDLVRLEPEAMIVVRPMSPGAREVDASVERLRTLAVPAAASDRIALLTHPDAFLPGSSVAEVAEALRRVLRTLSEPAS